MEKINLQMPDLLSMKNCKEIVNAIVEANKQGLNGMQIKEMAVEENFLSDGRNVTFTYQKKDNLK